MAEQFLHLSNAERREIIQTLSFKIGKPAKILEKDVWVCWVLEALFTMPDRLPMAFKGGTSLSKIYETINRFSEDVDITIDYRELAKAIGDDFDPCAEGQTKNQIRKFSDRLKAAVDEHAHRQVMPYLQTCLDTFPNADEHRLEIEDGGEAIYLHYPSDIVSDDDYHKDRILIELGGRNEIDPNEVHIVTAELAEYLPELVFPSAKVTALAAERTFWEKATLIHVQCNRGRFKSDPERQSRHWYDLHILLNGDIGKSALENRDLLKDVVELKKFFYNAGYANYDDCLNGGFNLSPTPEMIQPLEYDYREMRNMIYGDKPTFDEILQSLKELELSLNQAS